MKKKLFLFMGIMLSGIIFLQAQVSSYSFSSSAGTYNEITGGTLLASTDTIDDADFMANTIGFNFVFNGIVYTQFSVNSNGFIALGATVVSSYLAISGGTSNNVISASNMDLEGNALAQLRYELQGTAPNQVLTIQWKEFSRYNDVGDNLNFQIKLYETTNEIRIVYGTMTKGATSRTAEVGLRGASSADFNNRATTTDWSATTAGAINTATCSLSATVFPTSGLTFSWIAPTCSAPTGLNVTGITATSADVNWVAPASGSPINYEWKVVLAGAGSGGVAVDNGTTVHPTVTDNASGLSGSTSYDLYVRTFCGGSDYSGWAGPYNFPTLCSNVSIFPFVESFDGVTYPPLCWTVAQVSGTGNWNRVTAGTYPTCATHSGAGMSRFNSYSFTAGVTSALITPGIDFPSDLYQVSFWMYRDGGYPAYTDLVNVFYNTSATVTGATLLGTINRSNTLSPVEAVVGWYQYTFPMPVGSTGSGRFVIFEAVSAYGNNIFVDDINIDVIPSCSPSTALSSTNLTTSSADLSWTTGGATIWNIEYGPDGFTQGTGTIIHNITTNPYTLSGLLPSTNYDWYIQDSCGLDDVSSWAGPSGFTTICGAISTYPWTENFDAVTIPDFPLCWFKENGDWVTTDNANSGDDADAHSGTQFLRESWSAVDEYIWTPGFQLTAGTSYDFSFWWAGDGDDEWTGDVFYNTSQISTGATQLGSSFVISTTTTTFTYEQVLNSFTPSVTGTYYFAIRVNCLTSAPWYLSFDDFRLEPTPSCPNPTALNVSNITISSADLAWTTGGASIWNIEYGPTGFTPGAGTLIHNVTTNPYTLNGLTASTTYDWYVQDSCGVDDVSTWSGPSTFSTECLTTSIPYTQDFEGAIFPPLCWDTIIANDNGSNYTWHPAVVLTRGVAQVLYDPALDLQDEWLLTPNFDFTTAEDIFLKFDWEASKYWMVYPNDNYDLIVYARINSGIWTQIWNENMSDTASMDEYIWITDSVSLIAYEGAANVQFAFQYIGTDGAELDIDNVNIYSTSTIDLALSQNDIHNCDTAGWLSPPITIHNVGTTEVPASSTVTATYIVNGGTPVVEILTIPSDLDPGDSVTLFFATPYHFNSFTTYNGTFAISYAGDVDITNDTTFFTVSFHGYPTVNLGIDTSICGPTTINLNARNPGATYAWWNGTSAQTHPVNVTYCGYGTTCNFWVDVSYTYSYQTCTKRDSIAITFNALPVVNLGVDTAFCLGGTLTLDAGAGCPDYDWSTLETTQTIDVSSTGTYSVTVTDVLGCEGSDAIFVNIAAAFDATITTTPLEFCSDLDPFNLTAVDAGGVWSGDGIINTSTGLFDPSQATIGNNEIIYFISGACGDSDTVDVTVNETFVPDLGSDTTICEGGSIFLDAGSFPADYLWWDGSTSQTNVFDTSSMPGIMVAIYWVELDNDGCVARDSITVTWEDCTGINGIDHVTMTIMPNPTNGEFMIDFGGLTGKTTVEVIDMQGRIVISKTLELTGVERSKFDLSSFTGGIYNIRILNGDHITVNKIIKN